jgi:hypothetical protein
MGRLDCGHSYHVYCIKQWLSQKNTCPVCKTAVSKNWNPNSRHAIGRSGWIRQILLSCTAPYIYIIIVQTQFIRCILQKENAMFWSCSIKLRILIPSYLGWLGKVFAVTVMTSLCFHNVSRLCLDSIVLILALNVLHRWSKVMSKI